MAYKSLLGSSVERPNNKPTKAALLAFVFTNNFHFTTLLLIGAFFQGLLVLVIPRCYALLPTALLLLYKFSDTLLITYQLKPNPYVEHAVLQRSTVIVPDADGELPDQPATEKVAVFLLGVKFNHPLGLFDTQSQVVADFAGKMLNELNTDAATNGFLGQSEWNRHDDKGAQELMIVFYFRSLADVHDYANGPLHRDAIMWWNRHNENQGLAHVGINHEIFEAPKRMYEAVYINCQPTRLGATTYLRKGDQLVGGTVEDRWMSPLVDASRGRLRTSKGRLGWSTTATATT